MCGIFAILYSKRNNSDIKVNVETLTKRGPDRTKEIVDVDKIFHLVFHRLCINDVSENGDQPFTNKGESIFVMCNGEIFNYQALVKKYNLELSSQSDCEIILRLYEKKLINKETIKEFNGDFAFLIYDKFQNKVILSRDRIGVRPLFYGFTKDNDFVVSSEIKAMSMCDEIHHVLPGTITTYFQEKGRNVNNELYFEVLNRITYSKPCQNLRNLLINSVKLRLLSDRPIGCLLSGGLDSSIVSSILCKLLGPKNVRTYSIGMEGSLDLLYAKKVADFLGTKHTEVLFTPEEGLKAIPEVIYHLESYDITTIRASVGMYLLGKYISENTNDKVIFSGEGSDEILCGYLYFHYAPTPRYAHEESLRLISELYKYDVLRADRCISSHGLELRVPFLDPNVVNFCTTIHGELKAPNGRIEKEILRDQFRGDLPDEVLWRRKDGFSDGVSSKTKSWYEYIKEFVEKEVGNEEFLNSNSKEVSKEAYYYKKIYNYFFPYYPKPIDYYWMPKWIKGIDQSNPSGRILKVFEE
jgi:asparagine synthase (glutamine-hydrolysing)